MPRGLTAAQIEQTVRELLSQSRRVTVRDVRHALRIRFGGSGRTERLCRILRQQEAQSRLHRLDPAEPDVAGLDDMAQLRERVRMAEARAMLSEEREREHQDLWARRYAEKVAEYERQPARVPRQSAGVPHDQYLRVYQRAAELARRLAKYEDPDRPAPED
jgi:hypothetical protein